MDIELSFTAMGTTGRLGTVQRVLVDARAHRVTELVIRDRAVFGHERIVPLAHVTGIEGQTIHLDLDAAGFAAMGGFVEERDRPPDPGATALPGTEQGQALVDTAGGYGTVTPPLGRPAGPRGQPHDMQHVVVGPGTPVLDVHGERVGAVQGLRFAAPTGVPSELTLRSGHLVTHDRAIPAAWVKELADHGVLLTVAKGEVDRLAQQT